MKIKVMTESLNIMYLIEITSNLTEANISVTLRSKGSKTWQKNNKISNTTNVHHNSAWWQLKHERRSTNVSMKLHIRTLDYCCEGS